MKKLFFIIILTILIWTATMVYIGPSLKANQELVSLAPASGEAVSVSNLAVAKDLISLDLRDIEVKDALKFLAAKADLNIVPTADVSGRITLMIKNAPVEDILEIIIRSNNLAYEKIGSIYNVMTEREYKARYGKEFDDLRQVRVFHLEFIVPEQAFTLIDSIKSSIGKVLLESDLGTIMVMDTPEKLDEIAQTLNSLEHKSTIKVFNLKYANATDLAKALKFQLDTKKVGLIKADKRTNQVIVETLPERMKSIEKVIKSLDQKTRQVLIDARIIQIKLNDDLSEGVEWEGLFELANKNGETTYVGSYPVSAVNAPGDDWRSRAQAITDTGYVGSYPFSGTTYDQTAGTRSVGTEQMHIGVVGKHDYDVLLKYLQTLGEVKILSNPKLSVINNQEAKIHVGERQAYITTSTTAGQTTTTVSEEVTFLDIGLQLFITPTINDEGYVTLNIKPDVSSVVGTLVTAQENRIPILDTSTAETTVMVKDGATVAIGGLSRREKDLDSQRIPFLGKIPVLGMLFKSDAKSSSRSELLIMVTAHIISGEELTTGGISDPGTKDHEEYKKYNDITTESDLTEYEKEKTVEEKSYQEYPDYRTETEYYPTIKPLKDE